ncbi:MAG: cytidylate kinase-like family protein [Bacteroidales bacterium]|nr:cytidylate kinase-like family protein [Bacteroidales bacterium]
MEKFFDYFDIRHRQDVMSKPASEDGPVITLSRLTGCDARLVAEEVVNILNRKEGVRKWKWIDKDIIHYIARELNINSERVESFYRGLGLSDMSEMIMAFSGGYVSSSRIKKAIRDVILPICREGYIVLVGRGGVSIAQNIPRSFHARLIAPFYWRVENVMKKKAVDISKAEEYVLNTDEKRHQLMTTFLEKKVLNIDYLFDITINRKSFGVEETAGMIVSMYETKTGHLKEAKPLSYPK